MCTLVPIAALLVVLPNAHFFAAGARHCFLDICCISQQDAALKARGIESLGALLDRSEYMLALVDERYFSRKSADRTRDLHIARTSRLTEGPAFDPRSSQACGVFLKWQHSLSARVWSGCASCRCTRGSLTRA